MLGVQNLSSYFGTAPKELKRLKGHDGESFTVAFHPKGALGLSGGSDTRLILWDLDKGEKAREFTGHTATISGAASRPTAHASPRAVGTARSDFGTLKPVTS